MSEDMRMFIWIGIFVVDLWIVLKHEWNQYTDD
jgi:hypothetical protein